MISKFTSTLTKDDSWVIELSVIPPELREDEAELMQKRWFDYRDLLPAQATELFANTYVEIYRDMYGAFIDIRDAEEIKPLTGVDLFESPDLLPFWRARQAADSLGCKYDFYLRFAFKRFVERGWRYFPRPNQLYGEELVLDIADSWEEAKRCMLYLAKSYRFDPAGYFGHPDQDAYHAYLVEQIKAREHQHMLLARLVFKEGVLPLERAQNEFSADVLKRAQFF